MISYHVFILFMFILDDVDHIKTWQNCWHEVYVLANKEISDISKHLLLCKKNYIRYKQSMEGSYKMDYLFSLCFIPATKYRVCCGQHRASWIQCCSNSSLQDIKELQKKGWSARSLWKFLKTLSTIDILWQLKLSAVP